MTYDARCIPGVPVRSITCVKRHQAAPKRSSKETRRIPEAQPAADDGSGSHEVKLNDLIRADPSLLSRTGNDVNVLLANNRGDTEEDLGLTTR